MATQLCADCGGAMQRGYLGDRGHGNVAGDGVLGGGRAGDGEVPGDVGRAQDFRPGAVRRVHLALRALRAAEELRPPRGPLLDAAAETMRRGRVSLFQE